MKALSIPLGVRNWRGTTLVLLLMLAPLLATLMLVPDGDVLTTALYARCLLVGIATLAAGVFLYLHWRITANETTAWLALLLAAAALPGLALGAFSLTHAETVETQAGWLFAFRAAILLGLIGALAVSVFHLEGFPQWARVGVAAGMLLLGLGSTVGGTMALPTGLLGAILLAGTTAVVLHRAIEAEKQEVEDLHLQLHAVEVGVREDRARLHEINTTVAGIASAQRLLSDGLGADRASALTAMMRAEVERLQRLVADRVPSRHRSVDLDDVIGQIVLSHLARGRVVDWQRSGLRAIGRADDIAEVVNVLLENAAVHGGPDAVAVRVTRDLDGHGITVTVSDRGSGIAPDLRDRLFDWGVSRPDSPGQGIGLHVAADIARQLGGRLELVPGTSGASFALHLAAATSEVSADEHVA